MLKWAPYPFVRITLSFIAGILFYILLGREFEFSLEILVFFFLSFLVVSFLAKRKKSAFYTHMAGLLGLFTFFASGLAIAHIRTQSHDNNHLLKLVVEPSHYIATVGDYVVQKSSYQSTVVQIEQALVNGQWQKVRGKVQLSVPHDSDKAYELNYGDVLLIRGSPQAVPPPANPNQFNYQEFLANRNVYHRHFLQHLQFTKLGNKPSFGLMHSSILLRRKLDDILKANLSEKREYSIASALILGIKDELDNSIRNTYANTGTMHVLAVSGLHVGLIFTVLMLVLSKFNKTGTQRLVSATLTLAILWGYAFVSGLSPSVMRAVLMFSLVTVGLALKRQTNIYNTVSVAALVLLFLNPYNLLEVGFQLSFLAVLGIVFMQPRLYSLLEIDNWLLDKVWALFTVAIAAQLATFALGLFYFHQFPVYFWLANVVVVPMATVVLYAGLFALAFSWVPVLDNLVFTIYHGLIWFMNEFNILVQQLPGALINGIDITLLQTIMIYLVILLFILFLIYKRLYYFLATICLIGVVSLQEIWETFTQKNQQLMAVYNVHGNTGIAMVQGHDARLLADSMFIQDEDNFTFNVLPHMRARGVAQPEFVSLEQPKGVDTRLHTLPDQNQLLVWKGSKWLILSHPPSLMPTNGFEVDYILVRDNVRLQPEQLRAYRFKKLILDASNRPWYRTKLIAQLEANQIPYYDIAAQGAFLKEIR